MTVPLSILDLAPISAGSSPQQALRNTVELARRAEEWGYHRFWLAEHHFARVASSASITLIGQVAAATSRIRVGSAAVQIGYHTSISIVEAFGTIDALHPGRLDLGLGRSGHRARHFGAESVRARNVRPLDDTVRGRTEVRDGVVIPPPFDPLRIADPSIFLAGQRALYQQGARPAEFADQVAEIRALLDGSYVDAEGIALHAVPGEGAQVQLWVFGSTAGASAELAGRLGLPFAAAYHVSPGTALDAVVAYRAAFRPSEVLAEPYVVVSADVVVAADDATAERLAAPYGHWVHSIRSGAGAADFADPATLTPLTPDQRRLVEDRLATQLVGAPETVVRRLAALQRVSGANELLITGITHDHRDRLESHRLLAEAWGLRQARAA
ncbi:LLM class flavin-dependent oxidoreductase [Nocardia cyriacigeorgica]|uniref:LLM class flavin-dependent oxidoreductase n=1 Tax=Nocardia cyriacigeorgica TaxID=135487 RepID=UPI001892D513|nr:LLM class flavin-dependent oxidoreductase [Nocardia cyriacigeorgica]MBF6455460.1 LLM class flavin-dependent oxidoreductase [Nocardia cyriacigeorgica]MBF6480775.1 LLM class flavin-dependent oxidoreductase [Nocardia cyriacigeorgica]MBF6553798.1 LLM class flavin-dependent oxidoreductase [Nocardia cyriacigeorgica]